MANVSRRRWKLVVAHEILNDDAVIEFTQQRVVELQSRS